MVAILPELTAAPPTVPLVFSLDASSKSSPPMATAAGPLIVTLLPIPTDCVPLTTTSLPNMAICDSAVVLPAAPILLRLPKMVFSTPLTEAFTILPLPTITLFDTLLLPILVIVLVVPPVEFMMILEPVPISVVTATAAPLTAIILSIKVLQINVA